MKLTINTNKFQEMLSKAIKGASNNRLIPLTSLLAIKLEEGVLSLTTTDATNYLTIKEDGIEGDDFYLVVQADNLVKLISKMTCDIVTLEVTDNTLLVKGNGTYKIGLVIDENGKPLTYPNPISTFSKTNKIGSMDIETVQTILTSVKPAIALTMAIPCYTNYYVGDCVLATDTFKISYLPTPLFNAPKLVSGELFDLLSVVTDATIDVYSDGNKILFESYHCMVYGFESSGLDNFSVDVIKNLVQRNFENNCKVYKNELLQLLDRISLFVNKDFDNGEIGLHFGNDSLSISSKQLNGIENINYIDVATKGEYDCKVDIKLLTSQVKAQNGDVITLEFGTDTTTPNTDDQSRAIKIIGSDITSVVALL